MKREILISPSLLAADPLRMGAEAADAENGGANFHHVDVMDGHFVPNLTFGLPFVKSLKQVSSIPLDVHIMVSNPEATALDYVAAGADYLTFHIEAACHSHRLIQVISEAGAKPGLAINPGSPMMLLEPLLEYVSIVNVMSVNPGFGGQKFIKRTLKSIEWLRNRIDRDSLDTLIEVDGGVNQETLPDIVAAGADVLVAGTAVYGARDRKAAINALKESANGL